MTSRHVPISSSRQSMQDNSNKKESRDCTTDSERKQEASNQARKQARKQEQDFKIYEFGDLFFSASQESKGVERDRSRSTLLKLSAHELRVVYIVDSGELGITHRWSS